jgi:hypothetical protein
MGDVESHELWREEKKRKEKAKPCGRKLYGKNEILE